MPQKVPGCAPAIEAFLLGTYILSCINEPYAYSELCQTSYVELFIKIINGWRSLTIFAKNFILNEGLVW